MATLPIDIIFTVILAKLPAKSLLRFKCVSKSFLGEISSPKFIKLHHLNAMTSNANRLLILPFKDKSMYIYDLDSPNVSPSICRYPTPIVKVEASCESYLLIRNNKHDVLVLFNPSTRTYRKLPLHHVSFHTDATIYGLCHCLDELHDDYKVVRFVEYKQHYSRNSLVRVDFNREIMIYSLRTDSWKWIERRTTSEKIVSPYGRSALVENHLLHLIITDDSGHSSEGRITRIACFDMKAERWGNDVFLPDVLLDDNISNLSRLGNPLDLSVLDGKLCILGLDVKECTYDLWIMKDYGVNESWMKLMRLGTYNDVYHPLAYRNQQLDELLYRRDDSGILFWYNLGSKEVIKAEFERVFGSRHSLGFICKGSLLNVPYSLPFRPLHVEDEEEEDDGDMGLGSIFG